MRTGAQALAVLLPGTRRKLLARLFADPRKAYYVRELTRLVRGSPGNVPRELARLEAAGILIRTKKGREVFYQADPASPVFAGLRALFRRG